MEEEEQSQDEQQEGKSPNLQEKAQDTKQAAKAIASATTGNWLGAAKEAIKSPTARKIITGVLLVIIIGCVLGITVLISACLPCLNGNCGKTETENLKPVENLTDIMKLLALSNSESARQQFILEKAQSLSKELESIRNSLSGETKTKVDSLIAKLQELIAFKGAKSQTQLKVQEIDKIWLQIKDELFKNTHGFVDFNDAGVSLNAFGDGTSHPITGLNYEVFRFEDPTTAEKYAEAAISFINQGSLANPGTLNGKTRKEYTRQCAELIWAVGDKIGINAASAKQLPDNSPTQRGDYIHFQPVSPYSKDRSVFSQHWAIKI
ncbi:MAG: hypothetical protein M1338_04715 [Patescibacteria group bacterium]|nr:hypothetical protein [Patescibacteria group bacterium]